MCNNNQNCKKQKISCTKLKSKRKTKKEKNALFCCIQERKNILPQWHHIGFNLFNQISKFKQSFSYVVSLNERAAIVLVQNTSMNVFILTREDGAVQQIIQFRSSATYTRKTDGIHNNAPIESLLQKKFLYTYRTAPDKLNSSEVDLTASQREKHQ